MKLLALLLLALLLLSGCATQLDLSEGDCSITLVDVDATANTPMVAGFRADGWVLVTRGECSAEMVEMYRSAAGL